MAFLTKSSWTAETTSRNKIVVLLAALFLCGFWCPAAAAQLKHIGLSEFDKLLICGKASFGKPVFVKAWGSWLVETMSAPSGEVGSACGSRDEITQAVSSKSAGFFEGSDFVFLVAPENTKLDGTYRYGTWKRLRIITDVVDFEPLINGSHKLTNQERTAVAAVILEQARTVPLSPPTEPDHNSETATLHQMLILDAHPLNSSVESVIAILGQQLGDKRLIYGELRDRKYQILWDSPLLPGGIPGLGYRDVDGDGTEEISLRGSLPGQRSHDTLVIFDKLGNELTRQSQDCEFVRGGDTSGTACPVVAYSWTFEESQNGRFEILARSDDGIERYRLVAGRFTLQPAAKTSRTKPSNTPSGPK
jgi:hypothetical protein